MKKKSQIVKEYNSVLSAFAETMYVLAERGRWKIDDYHKSDNKSYYPFIPHSPTSTIFSLMKVKELLYKDNPNRFAPYFLDVGCGIGNIMLMAQGFGFSVSGIEYSDKILKQALYHVYNMGTNGNGIIKGDAFDYRGYDNYDVIYYYCPACDHNIEVKLEKLIEDKAKVGAYIIANLKHDESILKDSRFIRVATEAEAYHQVSGIYKKIAK